MGHYTRFFSFLVAFTTWVFFFNYLSIRFYGIHGYFLEGYGFFDWLIVVPVIFFTSFFVSNFIKNISDFIFLLSILVLYYPLLYLSTADWFIYWIVLASFVGNIFLWYLVRDVIYLSRWRVKPRIWLIVLVVLLFCFSFIFSFGIKLDLIRFSGSLYKVRETFSSSFSGLNVYLFTLTEYFVVPLSLYLALCCNRFYVRLFFFCVAVLLAFLVFSHSALKSSLFIIPFLLSGYFIIGHRHRIDLRFFVVVYSMIIALLIFLYGFVGISSGLGALRYGLDHTLRRFFVSPALNSFYTLSLFFEKYSMWEGGVDKMGLEVSNYFYYTDGNATTGMVADAMARGGIFFYVIFPFIFISFLSLLKNVTFHMQLRQQFLLFGFSAYVLINTSILTAQLTYGVSCMMLVVYLSFARSPFFERQ